MSTALFKSKALLMDWKLGLLAAAASAFWMSAATGLASVPIFWGEDWWKHVLMAACGGIGGALKAIRRYRKEHPISEVWDEKTDRRITKRPVTVDLRQP